MTGSARAEEDRVTVRGLNQRLQLTGWQSSWLAKGESVPPVHTLPGGKILAVVKTPDKEPRDLVMWSKEGQELARSSLDLSGDVVTSRVFGKHLIIASKDEVGEYGIDDLRGGRARKLPVPEEKATYFAATTGLWVVTEQTLSYFDLDGRTPVTRNRPLVAVSNKPACSTDDPTSIKAPCSAGFQPHEAEMLVSDTGEMLIIDVYLERYPLGTAGTVPDQVWPSVVTVLDPGGNVVMHRPYSWMKGKREWLWTQSGSPQAGGPVDWSLMRSRYETDGIGAGRFFTSRGTDFLFTSGSRETILAAQGSWVQPALEAERAEFCRSNCHLSVLVIVYSHSRQEANRRPRTTHPIATVGIAHPCPQQRLLPLRQHQRRRLGQAGADHQHFGHRPRT